MFSILLSALTGLADLPEPPCAAPGDIFARVETVGVARSDRDSPVLYCEYHTQVGESRVQVAYYSPEGNRFAEKTLNYGADLSQPEFVQHDQRTGEMHKANYSNGHWRLYYQESRDSQLQQAKLDKKDVDVVDAGFDHSVRQYWDRLHTGDKIAVDFASTVFQRSLALRIGRKSSERCPQVKGGSTCLWVEADNAFVRLFVDPLQLVYNDSKQLLLFQGVVNIQNHEGDKQSAFIRYYYRE